MGNQLAKIFALSLLICLASCSKQPPSDGKKTQEEFASSAKPFPYKVSEQRNKEIVDSYPKLRKGMSKEEAAKLMGEPDYSDLVYSNGFLGPKYHGSTWVYCIYCTSQFVRTSGGERYITIYFDLDGKVEDIWNHLKGYEEK
jgi:outer membrane protein assembly factor BamE (lipoprotein component of BamABCDE complex)